MFELSRRTALNQMPAQIIKTKTLMSVLYQKSGTLASPCQLLHHKIKLFQAVGFNLLLIHHDFKKKYSEMQYSFIYVRYHEKGVTKYTIFITTSVEKLQMILIKQF